MYPRWPTVQSADLPSAAVNDRTTGHTDSPKGVVGSPLTGPGDMWSKLAVRGKEVRDERQEAHSGADRAAENVNLFETDVVGKVCSQATSCVGRLIQATPSPTDAQEPLRQHLAGWRR